MANSKGRRPQTPKVGNPAYMKGMQQIKFGSAAGPHMPATAYRRKPKHPGKGWQ